MAYDEHSSASTVTEAAKTNVAKAVAAVTGGACKPFAIEGKRTNEPYPIMSFGFSLPKEMVGDRDAQQIADEARSLIIASSPELTVVASDTPPYKGMITSVVDEGENFKFTLHIDGKEHQVANAQIPEPHAHSRINPAKGDGGHGK